MRDAQRSSEKFTQHTSNAGKALKAAVAAFSVGVVVDQMRNWVAAARDSNKTAAQTAAVLKSTHGAAGLTADQFAKLAGQISKTAAIDDDLVQSGANLIATFTQIHGETFKKTTQAAVDMTAAMNHGEVTQEGLKGSAILLGKALNDPLRGLSALTRVGVTFSEQQRQQIADFVKHGEVAKAQGVILAEVNKEFGGSAAAAVTPAKQLAVTWGNMQEVLGNLLIPAIDRGAKILNGILEVVDRNRTAFGVLFGVLGTGAAIIGALTVAAKVHSAVIDGMKAVTEGWKGAQKGLNTVLGVTKVQAVTTAVAEEGLAASTTAAGAAAGGATAKFALLRGAAGLGLLGLAAAAVGISFVKLKDSLKSAAAENEKYGRTAMVGGKGGQLFAQRVDQLGEAHKKAAKSTGEDALQTAFAAKQTAAQRLEMVKALPQFATSADKLALNAEKAKELGGKLAALKDQWKQQVGAVKDAILSYDGLISQSKVTAGQVVKDLNTQVRNFQTYSVDVKRLIKAGVSQEAIQELSTKGPQYVHALATGTNRELETYKSYWADRQREVKGRFATSMQEQFLDLVRQIRRMQAEINKLKGKSVKIDVDWTHPHAGLAGLSVKIVGGPSRKGRRLPGYGGGDRIPLLAEAGETVVSKEHSRLPFMREAFQAAGVPGYRGGGFVGTRNYFAQMRRDMGPLASRLGAAWGSVLRKQTLGTGGPADVNSVARWTAGVLGRPNEWAAWARRIMFESGGNWSAVNRWDSNWFAGHPSVGGAQVIRGTFAANAGPYRGVGPFLYGVSINPRANSYAGAHYAIGRYGSMAAVDPRVRPRGYDRGGWLPPGLSVAYNGTGRPEPVGASRVVLEVRSGGSRFDDLLAETIQKLIRTGKIVVK